MIVDKGEPNITGGILIDWDLCKIVNPEDKRTSACQFRCTVSKCEVPLILE